MTLRERVKGLAKQKGVPLSKVENDCELGGGYLSKLDKSVPNSANLEKLANYFGVSLDYLNGKEKNEENQYADEYAHLVGKIRNDAELSKALLKYFELSDEKKKHVVELINLFSAEDK